MTPTARRSMIPESSRRSTVRRKSDKPISPLEKKSFQNKAFKARIMQRIRMMQAAQKKTASYYQIQALRPTLAVFKDEVVQEERLTHTSQEFFGRGFFSEKVFPKWLADRKDFRAYFPRFCEDDQSFHEVVRSMPMDVLLLTALINSPGFQHMDEHQIRQYIIETYCIPCFYNVMIIYVHVCYTNFVLICCKKF